MVILLQPYMRQGADVHMLISTGNVQVECGAMLGLAALFCA